MFSSSIVDFRSVTRQWISYVLNRLNTLRIGQFNRRQLVAKGSKLTNAPYDVIALIVSTVFYQIPFAVCS